MPDIFLSYAREDQATARRYAEALQREGFEVWWDQALHPGETFDQVTENALREARAVVVLWSRQSVTSRWVRSEATQADRFGTLVPVMIEVCDRPIMFELTHTEELVGWAGDANDPRWSSFVDRLRRFLDRDGMTSIEQLPDSAATPPPFPGGHAPRPASRVFPLRLVLALVAVLIAGGVGAWWYLSHDRAASSALAGLPADNRVSLAVLPFVDLSAAKDQEYFSDGLTEEILNQLAQIQGLRVSGRTSSFSFKGRDEDLRDIARQLGVANLLEGSVRRDGTRLRITAQLIDGRDGSHRWSQAYDKQVSDVFDLQEEVARDVAQALSITLDVGAIRREQGGTTNVEAYDLYLQAHKILQDASRESAQRALPILRQAVAVDADFALAWRDLALAIGGGALDAVADQARSAQDEAGVAMARAASLAPDTWWAQVPHVEELTQQGDWAGAEQLLDELRGDAPLSAATLELNQQYAAFLCMSGHVGEALRILQQLIQIDAQNLGMSSQLQVFAMADRQFDDMAEREYQRSLALPGDHQRAHYARFTRMLASKSAAPAQIKAQFQLMLQSQNLPMKFLDEVAKVVNDRAAVIALLRAALDEPENANTTRIQVLALTADVYGDRDMTWTWLKRLQDATGNGATLLTWLLPTSGLRADPRFKDLVKELKLDQYWRESGHWGDFCKSVGEDDFECH